MFAGPNGSGKSTIKEVVPSELLGIYINPDEIEKKLRKTGQLNLISFQVKSTNTEFIAYLKNSSLLKKVELLHQLDAFSCTKNIISLGCVEINSYYASVISSFIREKLLDSKISFTFETVMSSSDKVEFLKKARKKGFRTYLYFVATEDPQINISRVAHRVKVGGHPVPEEKIVSRYHRSLSLLPQAINNTDRAYFFDNSGDKSVWLAEVVNGTELEYKSELIPNWFKSALKEMFV